MNKNIFKSIGAVIAGFAAVVVLSVVTDAVAEKLGVFPPASDPAAYVNWMLALALAYRTIYSVAGGYITAALAPNRPLRHAVILGLIGLLAGTLGALANKDKILPQTAWYPVMLVIFSFPAVWLGGYIRTENLNDQQDKSQIVNSKQ